MAHPYANSPLNHCDSEMMHQGGWAKMRTLNSPGTNSENSFCWDGYKKDGVKDSPSGTGETVNNCVKK